jgi:signal transduction histidine kinase/ActR/RegA family two-component response regulator
MAETTKNKNLENRVLVLMPTGRDAALICATLEKVGIAAETCVKTEDLTNQINAGAGAILLAEEALERKTLERLSEVFDAQPVWSDLPVVLFAGNAQNAEILAATIGTRFNATIVERPMRIPMLISAVRGALRARDRQYQSRNLLNQLEESDRQKDLFLATLSHELRTPLNSILGWIQMLNGDKSRKQINEKHAFSVIERNARAQVEMISDILFVSRIITGKLKLKLEPTDIIPVAQTAIDALLPSLETKQINLYTTFEPQVKKVNGDADRLQQVFWNLLSNAIKFTPNKGYIGVHIGGESEIEIKISDSGQGIKKEFLPYVFERFRQADNSYTRQFGGLGLGLAIVRHLVELHNGTITVESEGENRGATFIVKLPCVKDELIAENQIFDKVSSLGDNSKTLSGLRVLLVEDDEDSREMLKVIFEQNDMKVSDVSSSAEAIEILKQIKPDILISDIGLPNEDGYDLIGKVRRLSPEQGGLTPAIALTGYVSLQERNHAFNVGFQEHLPKPVDIDKLLDLVEKLARDNKTERNP